MRSGVANSCAVLCRAPASLPLSIWLSFATVISCRVVFVVFFIFGIFLDLRFSSPLVAWFPAISFSFHSECRISWRHRGFSIAIALCRGYKTWNLKEPWGSLLSFTFESATRWCEENIWGEDKVFYCWPQKWALWRYDSWLQKVGSFFLKISMVELTIHFFITKTFSKFAPSSPLLLFSIL
jgi:hypothetical protein